MWVCVCADGVSRCFLSSRRGQRPLLWVRSFSATHILRICRLGEMGPHSVVPRLAELQENSNTKQMSTQTKWSLETQQNREHRRKPEKGMREKEMKNRRQTVIKGQFTQITLSQPQYSKIMEFCMCNSQLCTQLNMKSFYFASMLHYSRFTSSVCFGDYPA